MRRSKRLFTAFRLAALPASAIVAFAFLTLAEQAALIVA